MPKKKSASDSSAPPKRPGPVGNFTGLRLDFLMLMLPVFLQKSKDGKTPGWWPTLYTEWWKRFEWRLKLEDPGDPNPDLYHNASVTVDNDEDLSEADLGAKKLEMTSTNQVSLLCTTLQCVF